ncbi:SAP30-binding protein-like [Diadema antillarum]|uniref:SAP30-binding protein-like n=1 Tax=Diadema antillarum TaxID=105358 RepID=UPI003A835370
MSLQSNESVGARSLAHLVSYASDSDEEKMKDEEEEEEDGEIAETEEGEKADGDDISAKETKTQLKHGASLVSYYTGEEEEGRKEEEEEDGVKGQTGSQSWSRSKVTPEPVKESSQLKRVSLVDKDYLTASMSLPESALSQKIRRLSAEEVSLPPEPPGRCPRQLQEKINGYYRKQQDVNQLIQRRKDFRNPSIYEKLIDFLGIDELGSNYPKDMYDPYCWEESSYYEALAKAQKEEIQKRKEKEKKERTKVEFVTGMVKKPQLQAALVTSTTGTAPSTSAASQGPVHGKNKKRKSKWDNPIQTLPPPVPLMQRPLISVVTTTITAQSVVSTTTSATGSKTTVISSIGTIKKPKMEK